VSSVQVSSVQDQERLFHRYSHLFERYKTRADDLAPTIERSLEKGKWLHIAAVLSVLLLAGAWFLKSPWWGWILAALFLFDLLAKRQDQKFHTALREQARAIGGMQALNEVMGAELGRGLN